MSDKKSRPPQKRASTLQEQARALGDPTRHRIFGYLAAANDAVDVGELTTHFALNHNAIRQHLAKLHDAGLVIRATAPATGPGRPRQMYRINPAADDRWGIGGPYRRLSLLLIEMLKTGDSAVDVGRRAGRRLDTGDYEDDRDVIDILGDAIARSGFDPHLHLSQRRVEVVLRTCPFADAAMTDPDTICALHLGMAQGLADQLEGTVVEGLEPHDPRRAGCRLRFGVITDAPMENES